ncbi:peptidoglycan-binding protein [Streptomyces sp. enrichment culture]|uniref:peptidoglycan-binding domain-containing protein n=1 Tax=Streptomyces sp. enrichment culture TaxID=1795815 RepID=UPI003F5794CA
MEQPNGNPCPECGAPRHRDNTPSCACTLRASDALRDARTAQAAAAEDFDPLRIRPYVELDGGTAGDTPDAPDRAPEGAPGGAPGGAPDGGRENGKAQGGQDVTAESGAPRAADATMPLRAVTPDAAGAPDASGAHAPTGTPAPAGSPGAGAPDAGSPTSVLPAPLAPPATEPSAADLHLFESGHPHPSEAAPAVDDTTDRAAAPAPRRRRTALLAAAGAVVAVVGAAGWASGLFSYETPSRDGAPPQDIRAGVPDPSSAAPSAAPATSASSAAPASASPSPSTSASASPSASPSPSASSAAPSPSEPAEPSATPASTAPADSPEETDEDDRDTTGPVLSRGDRGPEVTELQLRLRQLYLYNDDINGQFTHRLEDALRNYQWSRGLQDELSVYGPATRARLESETREP